MTGVCKYPDRCASDGVSCAYPRCFWYKDSSDTKQELLVKACGSILWLNNNRHNYGSELWLKFFDAAVEDAKRALNVDAKIT